MVIGSMFLGQRLRALTTTAAFWALAWLLVLSPLVAYRWHDARTNFFEHRPPALALLGALLLAPIVWGAFSGVAFAGLTILFGRTVGWHGLRLPVVAAWGFASGLLAPLVLGALWAFGGLTADMVSGWLGLALASGTINGCLAAGSLAIAKGRPSVSRHLDAAT
jgi:hypothetical protein